MNCSSEKSRVRLMELRNRAKRLGVRVSLVMTREDLIHQIQIKEGNTACFKTDITNCQQIDCCWHFECQGW
jgi:hypothetical protein